MGVPVIFGWGKKGKEFGYVGIDKCPNCKNYVHFRLYEYANTINAYFIPVARFNKKIYLVCPVCEAAWELSGELKEEMIEQSISTLDPQTTQNIWDKAREISNKYAEQYLEKYGEIWINKLMDKCTKEITKEIENEEYVKKVVIKYLQQCFDEDKAD